MSAPITGWLTDMTADERQSMVGCTVTVSHNLRSATGLLVRFNDDDTLTVVGADVSDPAVFPVAGTYIRPLDAPRRQALAGALDARLDWIAKLATFQNEEGEIVDDDAYGYAKGDYEYEISDALHTLIDEQLGHIFGGSEAGQGER